MQRNVVTVLPRLFLLVAFSAGIFVVCGKDDGQSTGQSSSAGQAAGRTDSAVIESTFKETMTRWNYRDMAALYDMEFGYVQDKFTYDQYLEQEAVKGAAIDSFYDFKVKSVQRFGDDSARVDNVIIMKGPTGNISEFPQTVTMYFYKGRWVRPVLGNFRFQKQYDEMVRKADSAAAAEEAEGLNN